MTILITGITGFLGSHLIKKLRKKYPDENILALVLPAEKEMCDKFTDYNVEFVFGNLASKDSIRKCLDGIDSVFHLAAVVEDLTPLSQFYEVNHFGTRNLLNEFIKGDPDTFIYISTMGVYGFDFPDQPIEETQPVNLIPGYRESKYFGEAEVFKFAQNYGFKASVLRPPVFFGPEDNHWTPNILNLVLSGKKIPLINRGRAKLAYSYVEDVVDALIKMYQLEKANGEVFNQTSFHTTTKEIFETVAKICNQEFRFYNLNYSLAMFIGLLGELQWKLLKKPPLINRYRVKQLGISRLVNTSKIEKLLGVSSKISFEKALTETCNWYLAR